MKLDVMKWKQATREIENQIREQKKAQRESGQPRWEKQIDGKWPFGGYVLLALKAKATELYAVRAMLRGREHPAARDWDDYRRELAKTKVLESLGLGIEERPAA